MLSIKYDEALAISQRRMGKILSRCAKLHQMMRSSDFIYKNAEIHVSFLVLL